MKFKHFSPKGFEFFFGLDSVSSVRHLDAHYDGRSTLTFEIKLDMLEPKLYRPEDMGTKQFISGLPVVGCNSNRPPYREPHTAYTFKTFKPDFGASVFVPNSLLKKPPQWVVYEIRLSNIDENGWGSKEIYIGQTTKGLLHRIRQHFKECATSNVRFKRYMRGEHGVTENRIFSARVLAHGYAGGSSAALHEETKFILSAVKAASTPQNMFDRDVVILNTSLNSGVFVNRVREITGEEVSHEEAEERHSQLVYSGRTWMGDVERTIGTVCNNPNNFSVDEVEQLIMLRDAGFGQQETANVLGCSLRRVQDFFNRKTYQFLQLPEAA